MRPTHSHSSIEAHEPGNDNGTYKEGARRRVLVVDDERIIADTLSAILRNAGYETNTCYDADSALQSCNSFLPELVITDVVMPGMNGVELAVTIRQRFPACKILLFSGQARTVDYLEQARRDGHDFEMLAKPIHPTELLAKIAQETVKNGIGATGHPVSYPEESCA